MSNLFRAVNNNTFTENGAPALNSSGSANVDLFFKAGSSRGVNLAPVFAKAFLENPEYATRIALWTRDVRGGAGERGQFANFVTELLKRDVETARAVLYKIPELGRFKDFMFFWGSELEHTAAELWVESIDSDNGLAAKWAPRKDSKGAKPLRAIKGMTEAEWRKFVVKRTNVVEQLMCGNKWSEIEYDKLPSLASARYNKAFNRHDPLRRQEFRVALEKGEATVNAGAVYPYDVIHSVRYDGTVANAQWESLPNYLEGSNESFLPLVDVSGSMGVTVSGSITAMDVAVSLGMYLAERNNSAFKNQFITFSESPEMIELKGNTLRDRYNNMVRSKWGFNTNLEKVFTLVLTSAIRGNLPQEDMPTKILILSDMQFDRCVNGSRNETLYENMKTQYSDAGYKLPQIVFWNIVGGRDTGNLPVSITDQGTALVSGFSPAIMTSLLGGDLDPTTVMLNTIMKDRYAV